MFANYILNKLLSLAVGSSGGPDGQTEGTLVNQIGQVVDDVQGTHGEGGENTSRLIEEAQVGDGETDRVDGPADGEDDLQGVESGLGGGGRELGGVHSGLTSDGLVQDVQPGSATKDEANELGHDVD